MAASGAGATSRADLRRGVASRTLSRGHVAVVAALLAAAVLASSVGRLRHRAAADARPTDRRRRPASRRRRGARSASTLVGDATFTADYDILTKSANVHSTATVVQARPISRSITIGDVRFLYDGPAIATCELDDRRLCSDRINDAG